MIIQARQRLQADDKNSEQASPHDSALNTILKHIVEASNAANMLKHTLRGGGDNQKASLMRELQESLDDAAQNVHDIKGELQNEQLDNSEDSQAEEAGGGPESLAARRLRANSEPVVDADEVSDGSAFETLIDGDPSDEEPLVQKVTYDDGGIEPPDEQALLRDDIPYQRAT